MAEPLLPKPPWLKAKLGQGADFGRLKKLVHRRGLHTVCEEALCPNMGRCWEHGRATLMILGGTCTRACRFCAVGSGAPPPPDADEPRRVAEAVQAMGLRDVVLTSVTRDDLPDGGAALWADTIRRVHAAVPGIVVEVLVPDFEGRPGPLMTVLEAAPDVLGHNLETVPSLYRAIRMQADYGRSLDVLRTAHRRGLVTKTGIMVGLGETGAEVKTLMRETVEGGGDIFTVGQYLQPTRAHLPVRRYVPPEEFDAYRAFGLEIGFKVVVSGPLVRSSYHSEEQAAFLRDRGVGAAQR